MARTWIKRLSERLFATGGAASNRSPAVKLGLEDLEGRLVLSGNIVAKSLYLATDGELMFGVGAATSSFNSWHGGAQYSSSDWSHYGDGNIYELNSAGNLFKVAPNGNTVHLYIPGDTTVQDIAVATDGTLWIETGMGALEKQVNSLTAGNISNGVAFAQVDAGVNYLQADYDGNGDIWAINTNYSDLTDYSQTVPYQPNGQFGRNYYSNSVIPWSGTIIGNQQVIDFAFGGSGNPFFLTDTGATKAHPTGVGSLVKLNLNTGGLTTVLNNAVLAEDWQNPWAEGTWANGFGTQAVYVDYNLPSPNAQWSGGNEYHGMVVNGY